MCFAEIGLAVMLIFSIKGIVVKKLFFYYSAMNAGKSTTLLQSSHNYKEKGMETLLFAPAIDTRFGKPMIYSRIGLKVEAVPFDEAFDFFAYVQEQQKRLCRLACVLIDEAHFLKRAQVAELTDITTELDIPVLTYGLRSDFLGNPFEGSTYLLVWAQEIVELKTICFCGKKATMNMRIDSEGRPVTEGNQIQVGGNESYQSTCLTHFKQFVPLSLQEVR
jgi:thymidine kinase